MQIFYKLKFSRSPKKVLREPIQQGKIALLAEAQQFASASKLLVRSSSSKVAQATTSNSHICLAYSCDRATAICKHAELLLTLSNSIFGAQMLCAKVN